MSNASSDFVVTREHRRFAEFCDACRRYRYMGLCYGSPGVGKTLSARHYANWDKVAAYRLYTCATAEEFAEVVGSTTVFYTQWSTRQDALSKILSIGARVSSHSP